MRINPELFKTRNILGLYIIFIIIINYLFCYLYTLPGYNPHLIDENNNYILKNIAFLFGEMIQNLLDGTSPGLIWFQSEGIKLESGRRLFVPYYLIFIHEYLTTNFYLIHLVKNLFFGLIVFFTIKLCNRKYNNFFLCACIFVIYYIPHNTFTILATEHEEGILNYLIIILFLVLVSENKFKSIWLSIIFTTIFFLKGSMFFLVLVLPFAYFFYEKENKYRYLLIIIVLLANILWGLNSYKKNGFFAFGAKSSSMNAINITSVTHNLFNKTYPVIRPDIHLERTYKIVKDNKITNEKDFVDILIKKGNEYIINNPYEYFVGVLKKIYVLNFSPFKDAQWLVSDDVSIGQYLYNLKNNIENPKIINPIRFSNLPNKLIFNLSLIILFYSIIRNSQNSIFLKKLNFYYFLILLTYLAPYMFAWLYPRHATSIYVLAHLYCLMFFMEKNSRLSNFLKKTIDKKY